MVKSYHGIVVGKVRGGTFQSWVMDQAQHLNLTGWVRYLEDRKAEILLQGEADKFKLFKDRMSEAPLPSVESVDFDVVEYEKAHTGFEMRG